ncbi:GNAT family N-acetyltransferase [Paenibacillus xylanilyticus]|uniref:GNAT family N-acetyltransferase n=1 Tax=Paenibacillus xylanilyticus TaxID=248903 RepID=UPI001FE3E6C0|nr:GNAT family N-acetyltransferase [Paenibacillus xylanilyticus]
MKTIESFFDPFPVLETERTLLRPLTYDDLDDMYSYCAVPAVSELIHGTRIRVRKIPKFLLILS